MSHCMMNLTILSLLVCFWSNSAASETIQKPIQFHEIQNVGIQDRTTAAAAYVRGKDNTNGECNDGGEPITTETECREARASPPYNCATCGSYLQKFSNAIVPKGCYMNDKNGRFTFYWNTHATGAAYDGAIPICKETDACNGHDGVSNDAGTMCCAKSCGTCGGEGCAKRDGGRKNCCGGTISRKNKKCGEEVAGNVTSAPCVL